MNSKYVSLLILLSLSFTALSYAQLGEQAGQPTMNVSVGSSATFNYSILNGGSTPINFTVILPTLNTIPHNATPTVTVTPMNGTLAPHSNMAVSIKVDVPGSDKPGLEWQGIVQVVEAAPTKITSSGEGAVITAGVAKILTIYSAAPKPIPLIYYIVAIVVVVIVIVAVISAVILRRSSKARTRMVARASRTAASVKSARKRAARKPVATRKPARKTAARKGTARKKGASKAKGSVKRTASRGSARKRASRSR